MRESEAGGKVVVQGVVSSGSCRVVGDRGSAVRDFLSVLWSLEGKASWGKGGHLAGKKRVKESFSLKGRELGCGFFLETEHISGARGNQKFSRLLLRASREVLWVRGGSLAGSRVADWFFWSKTWSPAGFVEKDTLRYDCYRLIDGFWLFITLLCLLLMFEYSLICLEWIMKATCCLLRYNLAFMFGIVNLSMSCLCCETPKESCQYLHSILFFFSPNQRTHG